MHIFIQINFDYRFVHMFENREKWIFCFVIREIENVLSRLCDKALPLLPLSYV